MSFLDHIILMFQMLRSYVPFFPPSWGLEEGLPTSYHKKTSCYEMLHGASRQRIS